MGTIKDYRIKMSTGTFKVHSEYFEGAAKVVEASRIRKNTDSMFHDMVKYLSEKHNNGDDWFGVDSFDDALNLLKVGYQPVVDDLKAALKPTRSGERGRFSFQNSVQGFAPVVPLALKGVPNCMIDMQMKPIKAKVLDVYYDATFLHDVSNEKIIATGKKVLSVIMKLEQSGYRFNLYMVQGHAGDHDCDMMIVKVKSADKPIDLKRISFPIAHTAFFRVIGFDWYGKFPGAKYRSGYGRNIAWGRSEEDLDAMAKQMWGKNAVYIAGANLLNKGDDYLKEVLTNERKNG